MASNCDYNASGRRWEKNAFITARACPAAHAQRHAEARSLFFDHHQKLPVRVARPVIMRSSTT